MNTLLASAPIQVPKPPIFRFFDSFKDTQVTAQTPFIILKFVMLFGMALYLVFGLVLIRQVGLMSRTVRTPIAPLLKTIVYIHFLLSLGLWILAAVVL